MPIKIDLHDSTSEIKVKPHSNEPIDMSAGHIPSDKRLELMIKKEIEDRIIADAFLQSEIDEMINLGARYLLIDEKEDGSIDISLLNGEEEVLDTKTITLTQKIIKNATLDYANSKVIYTCNDETTIELDIGDIVDAITTNATNIANEISRATNRENEIESNLNAEVTRATSAEATLQININNEQSRAINAEQNLQSQIDDISGDTEQLRADLDAEILRATTKESELQTALNNEATARQNADNDFNTRLEAEINRATTKEGELNTAITSEASTRASEITRVGGLVDAEESRAITAEQALGQRINDLDLTEVGESGSYIKLVSQENGLVSASAQSFDTTLSDATDNNAPTSKAVKDYADAISGDITEHINDKNNPHEVTKAQVGLGNVVNTGDSDTPLQNGTEKFTTGGAYTLQATLEIAIEDEQEARQESDDTLQDNIDTVAGDLSSHINNKNNPHEVTKTQIGLSNVDNTSDLNKPISTATQSALDLKADKATTYTKTETDNLLNTKQDEITSENKLDADLVDDSTSTNKFVTSSLIDDINANTSARHTHANKSILDDTTASYTTQEKTKLSGIEANAQVNVLESISVNGSEQTITDKNVDITVPTKTSDLQNDGDGTNAFITNATAQITESQVTNLASDLNSKVDKVQGKGLSTNDFSDTYKNKLDGIEAGAEVNVQANWNESDSSSDAFIQNKPSIYTQSEIDDLLDTKQDNLTFDITPTADSTNPVTSGGIKSYVDTYGGKIDSISVNGAPQTIVNKNVDITVPTKVSDLTNDVVSLTTTTGSEAITVDSDTLNVVTRDTAQTISGQKTFTGQVKVKRPADGGGYFYINPDSNGYNVKVGFSSGGELMIHNGGIQANRTLCPSGNIDLGTSSAKWRDLYLSGAIKDGTNTFTLPNESGQLALVDDIPTNTSDLTNDGDGTSPFATESYVDTNGGKIDSISVDGTPQTIDANKNVDLPAYPTKTSLGLDQVVNTGDSATPVSGGTTKFTTGGAYTLQTTLQGNIDTEESARISADEGLQDAIDDVSSDLTSHTSNTSNPHNVTKAQVGLGNVDNTSDLNKPISTATQTALNLKADSSDLTQEISDRQTADATIDNKLDVNVHIEGNADEITYNGDTVTKASPYQNLKTGTTGTRSEVIQLANSTTAGMMSFEDYNYLRQIGDRVDQLEGQTRRLLYTDSTSPSASDIADFVDDYLTSIGITPSPEEYAGIAVVVVGTYHIWHYYNDDNLWKDDGLDTVTQFTNSIAGIILGSTGDGKVFAENDGTGSVNGWDALKTRVSNLETGMVSNVTYDTTNKKITKTINGVTSDVVTTATIKSDLGLATVATTGSYNDLDNKPNISDVSLTTTADSEAITVDDTTLSIVTRNTTQTITGEKTFKGGIKIGNSTSSSTPQILLDSSDRIAFYFGNNPKVKMGQLDTLFANRITPDSSNTYDIGRSGVYWRDLYLSRNLTDGTNSIAIANITNKNDLGAVAFSNDYDDLDNKPTIPDVSDFVTMSTAQTITGEKTILDTYIDFKKTGLNNYWSISLEQYENLDFTRNHNSIFKMGPQSFFPTSNNARDLGTSSLKWKNLYLIGNLSDGTNSITIADIANKTDLGAVAFSNDYNDLDNLPNIPEYELVSYATADTGRVEYLEDITYTSASASGTDTFVKTINGGSGTFTPATKYLHTTTQSVITGITQGSGSFTPTTKYMNVSYTAGTAVTGGTTKYIHFSQGSLPTKKSQSIVDGFSTNASMNFDTGTSTDTPYVSSISSTGASGTPTTRYLHATTTAVSTGVSSDNVDVASSAHTHTVTATGNVSLGSNDTSTGGVAYIQSVTKGSYTPAGEVTLASNNFTTTNVLTGVKASGSDTFIKSVTAGSFYGTRSTSGSGTTARRTLGVSYTSASAGSSASAITGVSSDGTASAYTGISSTKPLFSGTATTSLVTGGTTKYFHPSFTGTSATTGTPSATENVINSVSSSGSANAITALSANTTSASGDITYLQSYSVSGGTVTPTTKYMKFTAPVLSSSNINIIDSVGTLPSITYDTTATNGQSFMADLSSGSVGGNVTLTNTESSGIQYMESATHTHTSASASGSQNVIKTISSETTQSTGDITYMESATHTHTGASVATTGNAVTGVTSGSVTKTTKYMDVQEKE